MTSHPTSISRTQAERIGAAIHLVRPDWPAKQVVTLITTTEAALWPPRDLFTALAYVALDRTTEGGWASDSPYRVLEHGPWQERKDTAGGEAERQRSLAEARKRADETELRRLDAQQCRTCNTDGRLPSGHLCRHQPPDTLTENARIRAEVRTKIRPTRTVVRPTTNQEDQPT